MENFNKKIDPIILSFCQTIQNAGGKALIVGGGVRSLLLKREVKDYDIEVYNMPQNVLVALLSKFGTVNMVGACFTVFKVHLTSTHTGLLEIDVSLPRTELKINKGHRGFSIRSFPHLPYHIAASRRDFTMNAIMYNPLTSEIIDPFNGREDIDNQIIRLVSPHTFVEDSLRVLRAMQFSGRFEFNIEPNTISACRAIDLDDLPKERIWGEFEKLFLLSKHPSIGLKAASKLLIFSKLFPDIERLKGVKQDPKWHPEGDVFEHTLLSVDNACALTVGLKKEKRLTVMLATLLHDIAKPQTTTFEGGHIRSYQHEEKGREPAGRVLEALNIHTINGFTVRDQVIALVTNHMKPSQFEHDKNKITDGAFRRLSEKCSLELLHLTAKADALGRGKISESSAADWFIDRACLLSVDKAPLKPILLGRHLLPLGVPPGPNMGKILRAVFEMQLDGLVTTDAEAMEVARMEIKKMENKD